MKAFSRNQYFPFVRGPKITILSAVLRRLIAAAVLFSPQLATANGVVSWLSSATSADELATVKEIDSQLASLPHPYLDMFPARGFHSEYLTSSAAAATVIIDMRQPRQIDTLALIPAVDTRLMKDYGFPVRYRIESSLDNIEWTPVVIREEPQPPPGGMPVVIPVGNVEARYFRIVPTELWQRADGLWLFALSEFMAFDGALNHAFFAEIESASAIKTSTASYSWAPYRLVDGLTNLGLPTVENTAVETRGFCSRTYGDPKCDEWIQIDLGKSYEISTVNLVPAITLDPDLRAGGFPAKYTIEFSDDPDFPPASTIQMPKYMSPRTTPQIGLNLSSSQVGRWPNSTARYVRVRMHELGKVPRRMFLEPPASTKKSYIAALSEIEVLASEENLPNVALGRPVSTSFESTAEPGSEWSLSALTDGHVAGTRLISTRQWLDLLSKRSDLERKRTLLLSRIEQSRDSISSLLLVGSLVISGSLVVILASLIFRFRSSTQKRLTTLRRQIARDLHDEVGSTLASIRLSGELGAGEPGRDPEICDEFREIRDAATAAGDSMRDIVWLIDAKQSSSRQLVAHLRGLVHAMLRDLPYEIDDRQLVLQPKVAIEVRRNTVLALKEVLNNVRLHSQATKVEIKLVVRPKEFSFVVSDNGVGIPKETIDDVRPQPLPQEESPKSDAESDSGRPGSDSSIEIRKTKVRHGLTNLFKRAEEHGGHCEINPGPDGGTTVSWSIRM